MGDFLSFAKLPQDVEDRTAEILHKEGVTVQMIIDGIVSMEDLAEAGLDAVAREEMPSAIQAWREKVRIGPETVLKPLFCRFFCSNFLLAILF